MKKNWFVELYQKQNMDCPVLSFMQLLSPKHRAKIEREIDLLEEFGINLAYPQELWELRVKFGSDISRIFYFLHIQDTFVLLHGFVKKSEDTPVNELRRAKDYMLDYLKRREEK